MIGALAAVTAVVVALDATVGLPGGVLGGRLLDHGTAAAEPSQSPVPAVPPQSAPPVLAPATAGTAPDPTALARVLSEILDTPALGTSVGAVVLDVTTGAVLYGRSPTAARTPASTAKLLTAVAALERLGADTRLETSVVETPVSAEGDPAGVPEIVLVGGGDPSLRQTPGGGDASLRALAHRTAVALHAAGTSTVRLRYDASLFAPPKASAAWPPAYVATGVVAPVTALSIGDGQVADPAREAADAFREELRRERVTVRGTPTSAEAETDAAELASVESRPVGVLVERMLTDSDNDYAEALGHLIAVAAGEPGTFQGGAAATLESLATLGIPTTGVELFDASGLARSDRVPADTLARLLALVATGAHAELAAAQTGLPVAGFNGTLTNRFVEKPESVGAGVVRAKTGTLTGVTALAGIVQDRQGRVLAFAFVADRVAAGAVLDAPAALDEAAAALAACGCR